MRLGRPVTARPVAASLDAFGAGLDGMAGAAETAKVGVAVVVSVADVVNVGGR